MLRAAVAFADERGIEALSMRKLGQELGVEAMSLYNHVAGKDDILNGIVETIAGEVEVAPAELDWKTAVRRSAISAHETLVRHPWAPALWMRGGRGGTARLRFADGLLGALRRGLSADLTYRAFHTLQSYILGYTLQELRFPFETEDLEEMAQTFLREFPSADYPHLAEHVHQHLEPHAFEEGGFAFGLDLILEGLERARGNA